MTTTIQTGAHLNQRAMQKGESAMPVLSKFYGIVIRILGAHAFAPRFHAIYNDSEIVVNIWPLVVVQGDAPRRVRAMVIEWASQHQQELLAAWNRCLAGGLPQPIAPLL